MSLQMMSSFLLSSNFTVPLPPSASKPKQKCIQGRRKVVNLRSIAPSPDTCLRRPGVVHCSNNQDDYVKLEMARRTAQFPPCIWGNFFLDYRQDEAKLDEWSKRAQVLKEKVRKILKDARGSPSEIYLVDVIKRVGLEYEFEAQVEEAIERIICKDNHVNDVHDVHRQGRDLLYQEALRFRVLREAGHKASADVFERFKDAEQGKKFKDSLTKDIQGLLSLYEAAFLGIRGEDILDEAIAFTTKHLKSSLAANTALHPVFAKRIGRALEIPTHKRLPIENVRDMISFYEWINTCSNQEDMRTLLEYAKLNFNLVQAVYQRELKELSLWWKKTGLTEKLPYTRNRIVEGHSLSMSGAPEPHFSPTRLFATKFAAIITLVDDTYDAFGEFEDLKKFTDAINKWEPAAMDEVPEFMKPIYHELLTLFEEFGEKLKREGLYHQLGYMKESTQELCRNYLIETEWRQSDYIPGIEEYNCVGVGQTCYHTACLPTMMFKKEASIEALEWWKSRPRYLMASAEFCRFANDFVGHKIEAEKKHTVKSVQCFMKEKEITKEEEVKVLFDHLYDVAWKEMNEACLIRPTPFPKCIYGIPVGIAQWCELNYMHTDRDEYTYPTAWTKEILTALFVDPIPI